MTSAQTLTRSVRAARPAQRSARPRRERRAVSYCDIWDLVASGEPCPACESSFEERLARARNAD